MSIESQRYAVEQNLVDVAINHQRISVTAGWFQCGRCAGDFTARGHAEHVAAKQVERLIEMGIMPATEPAS